MTASATVASRPSVLAEPERPGTVGVVGKALAVLEAFQGRRAALGVTEVAHRAGLPKSTTHRLLTVLAEHGYVERRGTRYTVGVILFELGNLVPHCQPWGLRATAIPFMADLLRTTDATVQLAVPAGDDVVIVEKLHGHHDAQVPTRAGDRLPARECALGRAVLAFDAPSATGDEVLDRSLAQVRKTGFAYERLGAPFGAISIATPVRSAADGAVLAALSVTLRKAELSHAHRALREAAMSIAQRCEGSPAALA